MQGFEQTTEEQISFRIKEIESVLGYIKNHLSSGQKAKASKETENLELNIWKLRELLKE
jgi:hypothetical protein